MDMLGNRALNEYSLSHPITSSLRLPLTPSLIFMVPFPITKP